MMKRKILSIILAFSLCAAVLAGVPIAAEARNAGSPAISAGGFSAVIKEDGSLWTWGNNYNGQLGDGTTIIKLDPVKVMDDVLYISAGAANGAAIKTDGSLWSWGDNRYGQVGDGERGQWNQRNAPVKIMDGVLSVSVGFNFTMAIKTDGSLWAWGRNNTVGSLGDSTSEDRPSPVKIMDGVSSVSIGDGGHTAVIMTDGSLWTWGWNTLGQLGNGVTDNRTGVISVPSKIMDGVASVSLGARFTMALKTDGSLWAWGGNSDGQLGDGTTEDRHSPVKIMDGVASFSAGGLHAMAVKTDGSLWGWGRNSFKNNDDREGMVGDGTTEDRHSPVRIMDGVLSVSAGLYHTMAVKTDGSLWTWGSNSFGAIGDGTRGRDNNRLLPVKIMDGVRLTESPPPAPADPDPTIDPDSVTRPNLESIYTANPTASAVLVNGENVAFDAYNINDNNYFKLRDLAYILSGTEKQFEVGWDGENNAISLTSGEPYSIAGGEMAGRGGGSQAAEPTSSKIYLDGSEVQFTAYNIQGNNYFRLRDIGEAFDFGVDWDGERNTIVIDTGKGYTPG